MDTYELVCQLDPDPGHALAVIAARQNGHEHEHVVRKIAERGRDVLAQIAHQLYLLSLAGLEVRLVQDSGTPVNEHVRVLGDDQVHRPRVRQPRHLRVGLVGRDEERDAPPPALLDQAVLDPLRDRTGLRVEPPRGAAVAGTLRGDRPVVRPVPLGAALEVLLSFGGERVAVDDEEDVDAKAPPEQLGLPRGVFGALRLGRPRPAAAAAVSPDAALAPRQVLDIAREDTLVEPRTGVDCHGQAPVFFEGHCAGDRGEACQQSLHPHRDDLAAFLKFNRVTPRRLTVHDYCLHELSSLSPFVFPVSEGSTRR
mmetsp:Transcript_35793/g.80431  ORF Transcript_35793/g.80431 Transcript_35793/m.80431 type:complete len:311 (+) Transcript_35793:1682-2614(+)